MEKLRNSLQTVQECKASLKRSLQIAENLEKRIRVDMSNVQLEYSGDQYSYLAFFLDIGIPTRFHKFHIRIPCILFHKESVHWVQLPGKINIEGVPPQHEEKLVEAIHAFLQHRNYCITLTQVANYFDIDWDSQVETHEFNILAHEAILHLQVGYCNTYKYSAAYYAQIINEMYNMQHYSLEEILDDFLEDIWTLKENHTGTSVCDSLHCYGKTAPTCDRYYRLIFGDIILNLCEECYNAYRLPEMWSELRDIILKEIESVMPPTCKSE